MGLISTLSRVMRKIGASREGKPARAHRPARRARRGFERETLPGGDSAEEAAKASPERAAELAD
jgi:hypothetical protein